MTPGIEDLDQCLPQTQCQSCTFDDCRDYAAAIATNAADIDRCPPGGAVTLGKLSALTGNHATQVNPELKPFTGYRVARIIEAECIGCTKCIQVCPTDAIIGSGKRMHTVLEDHCTGCELCLPPCPVDCIQLEQVDVEPGQWPDFSDAMVERFRKLRVRNQQRQPVKQAKSMHRDSQKSIESEILAAVERSRQRRNMNRNG